MPTTTTTDEETTSASSVEEIQTQLTDLSRSMIRFSWAMAVFGAQQAANMATVATPGKSGSSVAEAFDAVANAVEEQFGGIFRGAYKTGNSLTESAMGVVTGREEETNDSDE